MRQDAPSILAATRHTLRQRLYRHHCAAAHDFNIKSFSGMRMVQVSLSQQAGQAKRVASRCLWDPSNDGSAWDHFDNDTLSCVCQVRWLMDTNIGVTAFGWVLC